MQSAVLSAIKEFIDFQRQHATICIHFNFKKLNQAHYDGPTKKAGKKKKQEYIENTVYAIKKKSRTHVAIHRY